jgi:hypothetical protein
MEKKTKRKLAKKFGTALNELGKLTFAGLVLGDIILGANRSNILLVAGSIASLILIGTGIVIETLFEEE